LGTYSEVATDNFLLSRIGDAKTATILGCAYCANQIIGYAKNIDAIGKMSFNGLRFSAYATEGEANRIKQMFEEHGVSTKIKVFTLPHLPYCQQSQKDRAAVAKVCQGSDAVVALTCNTGFDGIKSALPPETTVISGMAALGTIQAYLTVDGGKVFLDKDKTKVIRFKQANQTA